MPHRADTTKPSAHKQGIFIMFITSLQLVHSYLFNGIATFLGEFVRGNIARDDLTGNQQAEHIGLKWVRTRPRYALVVDTMDMVA